MTKKEILSSAEIAEMEDFKGLPFSTIEKLVDLANEKAGAILQATELRQRVFEDCQKAAFTFMRSIDSRFHPEVVATVLKKKMETLLEKYVPEPQDGGQLQWRDHTGKLLTNVKTDFSPFQTGELFLHELDGVFSPIEGNGSEQPAGIDLSGAKTQVEADEIISQHLFSQGFKPATVSMAQEQARIRAAANVGKLPLNA